MSLNVSLLENDEQLEKLIPLILSYTHSSDASLAQNLMEVALSKSSPNHLTLFASSEDSYVAYITCQFLDPKTVLVTQCLSKHPEGVQSLINALLPKLKLLSNGEVEKIVAFCDFLQVRVYRKYGAKLIKYVVQLDIT